MFGVKDLQNPYPIHMYWIRYYEKLSKGYVDSSDIYLAPQYTTKQEVKTKDSDVAAALYEKLYRYAKGMVETHLVNQNVTVASGGIFRLKGDFYELLYQRLTFISQ